MAIALSGYRRYLRTRAATWERLALSRARVVAGDEELGKDVNRAIERFVFSGEVDETLVAEMATMRRRMEPRPERGKPLQIDIKRGSGGIVDVEFITQLLVLKHGWKKRDLRLTNTREALNRMKELGLVDAQVGRRLLETYERLREVEKGMRIASEQAENELPEGRELGVLARAVGETDPEGFKRNIGELMQENRELFNIFFAVEANLE